MRQSIRTKHNASGRADELLHAAYAWLILLGGERLARAVAFREAVDMPGLTPHNLRHTYISLMLRAGVDLKTIQKNVGHASPRMIMEIYGETFDESQVESMGKLFGMLEAVAREEDAA